MRQLVSWWASFSSPAQNLFHLSLFSFFPTDNWNWTGFPQRIQHWYYLPAFKWFQCNFQFLFFLFFLPHSLKTVCKTIWALLSIFISFLSILYPHCVHSFIELFHQFIPHEPNFAGVFKTFPGWTYWSHPFLWYEMSMISNILSEQTFGEPWS